MQDSSVVAVIEIGTETAVFRQNRTEPEVLRLFVGGFENGAALVSWPRRCRRACCRRLCRRRCPPRARGRLGTFE